MNQSEIIEKCVERLIDAGEIHPDIISDALTEALLALIREIREAVKGMKDLNNSDPEAGSFNAGIDSVLSLLSKLEK